MSGSVETMAEVDDTHINDVDSARLLNPNRQGWLHNFHFPRRRRRNGEANGRDVPDDHQHPTSNNEEETDDLDSAGSHQGTLGTFQGVFAPVCLSMFSSLLFLRIGYIVGNAGFALTMLQLVVAYCILLCTVMSISAIATNGAVKGGGVYFMISRTLGPQLGGSVGVLFYLANVVGGALFASGFSESLVTNFGPGGIVADMIPDGRYYRFAYGCGVLMVCLGISLIGSKAFGKASFVLFFAVVAITLSVSCGFFRNTQIVSQYNDTTVSNCTVNCSYAMFNGTFSGLTYEHGVQIEELWYDNVKPTFGRDCESRTVPVSFFSVFGVLFSGVTGIMAGANVSGDLKAPAKSIPNGTLAACAFTFISYTMLFLLTALTCDRTLLYHDCMYMMKVDFLPWFVMVGALLATFCACLSALIGASRVVEALVKDTMFGRYAEAVFGKTTIGGNPILAVLITFVLIVSCLLIGSLNKIAQLSSVLFLLSYMTVNLACLFLEWASAPNFRPTFKYYNLATCLFGMIGSLCMMFVISVMYSAICLMTCLLFVLLFNFTSQPRQREWGSIGQALMFHQVRKYLLLLDPRKDHVKFWRPQILLLVSNPRHSCSLIDFINAIKKGGLYVLGHVHVGDFDTMNEGDPSLTETPDWLSLIDQLKVKAFPEVTVAKTVREGVQQLARISGIGAMKPNTIVLGFGGDSEPSQDDFTDPTSPFHTERCDALFHSCNSKRDHLGPVDLMQTVSDLLRLEKNVCIARNFERLNRNLIPLERSVATLFRRNNDRDKRTKRFLDVWLIDFFSKPSNKMNDHASMFLLQLATVLQMAQGWTALKIRVFIRVMSQDAEDAMCKKLLYILQTMRIPGTVHTVPFQRIYKLVEDAGAVVEGTTKLDMMKIPNQFMASTNEIIQSHCAETAVSFFYMPKPSINEEEQERMYQLLRLQTDNLPPLLLVHGLRQVVSASL